MQSVEESALNIVDIDRTASQLVMICLLRVPVVAEPGSVVVNVTHTGSNYWLPDGRRAGLPVAAKHRRLQQRLINTVHAAASNAVTIPLPVCPRHASRPFR